MSNLELRIGQRMVGDGHPTFVIAEAGVNHNGSIELARQLIDIAAEAGADAVKFQMRDAAELYREGVVDDMSGEDIGFQYIMHLIKSCELTPTQYGDLAAYAASKRLMFLCTPWDRRSVDVLDEIGVPAFKTASADLTNLQLLEAVLAKGKPVIVSTGMSTMAEIETTVRFLRERDAAFALLHCNSAYPTAFKDVNLRFMQTLRARFDCLVGYSGHELGIAVSSASVVAGACIIERHFTLDRTMRGPDHAMSLEPTGLKKLVRDVRHVEQSLGTGVRSMSRGEYMNRKVLGKSVVATRDLAPGDLITPDACAIKSPANGLSPQRVQELYGRAVRRPIRSGGYFFERDLSEEALAVRTFSSSNRWGLIVRYHDLKEIVGGSHPPVLEFHFSSQDLARLSEVPVMPGTELIVHAPELYGDQLLDLCARDEAVRRLSVANVQSAIEVTRRLRASFPDSPKDIKFVLHTGGMTYDRPATEAEKDVMYERLSTSLKELDRSGVEVLLENVPPIPWYKGGQWHSNTFTDADRMLKFCTDEGYLMCYDTSHAQLFCNSAGVSQKDYFELLKPLVRHLHISDGAGLDSEGLQIGDGDVDFKVLSPLLLETGASFTPEIWMGHKEDGEGFWVALNRLRAFGF